LGRRHDAKAGDIDRRARDHHEAKPEAVGKRADQSLGQAPDDILDRQREREIRRRDAEILGDGRQKQPEALAYAHAEREQQGGADQDQPSLTGARGNHS